MRGGIDWGSVNPGRTRHPETTGSLASRAHVAGEEGHGGSAGRGHGTGETAVAAGGAGAAGVVVVVPLGLSVYVVADFIHIIKNIFLKICWRGGLQC